MCFERWLAGTPQATANLACESIDYMIPGEPSLASIKPRLVSNITRGWVIEFPRDRVEVVGRGGVSNAKLVAQVRFPVRVFSLPPPT